MNDIFIWHENHVPAVDRAKLKSQNPLVVWFTGLSGAGKSTLANALEVQLHRQGYHTFLLDGDNIRHGLNSDLDLSVHGRKENIRRIGEVCKLFVDAGIIAITAFISPYREDRDRVRQLIGTENFVEVFVDASLQSCQQRDPKSLYAMASSGEISGMTGIDDPYEPPNNPELAVKTDGLAVEECLEQITQYVVQRVYAAN
ncbi:adenylyl-sulfate kinase [Halorhodospira halochloris]|nr:adenylyl-sulfate kinase [Halorhodospira halochloris]MBK1650924.1 adenylyl-sulfate kinase [Halorhodospira halochloris]MCG5529291.1 adenylyl-sulfate kinase [Halorhodospira halochloris]